MNPASGHGRATFGWLSFLFGRALTTFARLLSFFLRQGVPDNGLRGPGTTHSGGEFLKGLQNHGHRGMGTASRDGPELEPKGVPSFLPH